MSSPQPVAIDPELRAQIGRGFELLRVGRQDDAARLSDRLLAAHGDNAEVLYLACESKLAIDALGPALELIVAAISAAPRQIPLLLKQARILLALRRRSEFRQVIADAEALAGSDAQALWAIGREHARGDDPQSAARLYLRARAAGCNEPALLYDLAGTQFFIGEFAAAEANLDAVLADAPRMGEALHLRSQLRRQTPERNHVADLETRLATRFPNDGARAACLYALAKELEDLGQPERSFETLTEAAKLMRATLRYDAAAEVAAIDAVRSTYTADALESLADGDAESGAIFIVGMPRTGTTLVERMLDRHRDVRSAGELLDFKLLLGAAAREAHARRPGSTPIVASLAIDFAALGRDYLRGAREAAPGRPMFIDKMPANYIYCGLIRKALPQARIIHLGRDPLDSCYAVYKTLFHQAYHFSYDLAELAGYYIAYHRLMQHWRNVLPDAILDVRYEDLVADPEAQARRILDWCGLDWQAQVLAPAANERPSTTASAAQVREPIHASSVQKWRLHAQGLTPLKVRLEAAGIVDADGVPV